MLVRVKYNSAWHIVSSQQLLASLILSINVAFDACLPNFRQV